MNRLACLLLVARNNIEFPYIDVLDGIEGLLFIHQCC